MAAAGNQAATTGRLIAAMRPANVMVGPLKALLLLREALDEYCGRPIKG
jgi:hypothetical protein